jgi:dihydroneopterin aldolase
VSANHEWVEIVDLEVKSKIGVPEKERESFQKLLVCILFQIDGGFRELNDQLDKTIDYGAVAAEVVRVAEENRAQLLETLVSEIADTLMARFRMLHLEVELKKLILPNTRYVSVKSIRRRRLQQSRD